MIDHWRARRIHDFRKLLAEEDAKIFDNPSLSEKDYISHHILRLAYAKRLYSWSVLTCCLVMVYKIGL